MRQQPEQSISPLRLGLVVAMLAAALIVLLWRAVDLHVVRKDFLRDQGDARHLRVVPVAAHRGVITDRHGEPLAISTPVDAIWANPTEFLQARHDWPRLATLLELDLRQLSRIVAERQERSFVYLKRGVQPDLARQVLDLGLPGVAAQREYRRYYPMGEVSAHLIGFTNIDDAGQEGLELAYDQWLAGRPGAKRVIKDRLGRIIADVESIREPDAGRDLALSIDRRIQYLAYRELKRAVLEHRAQAGSAVILDARTGEALAIVNQPAYNPNNRSQLKGSRYRNRAITDVFEPGSTIKPFTVAAALQSGKFVATTAIDTAPGTMRVSGSTIRDIRNYGRIDLTTLIQKSSNVGASKLALSMPAADLWAVLNGVGFGATSGSGYPGEALGLLSHHSGWRDIERATLAFGYGVSVTALQLAQAYTVFAEGGCLRTVTLLRVDGEAAPCQPVLHRTTAQAVLRMMETVVNEGGTATQAQVAGYRVAGKTGTVRKAAGGGYSEDRYQAVFAGIAPASDPRLVMVVTIDEPRTEEYYGGQVAAPVFARVMAGALRLLDVAPDALPAPGTHMARRGESL